MIAIILQSNQTAPGWSRADANRGGGAQDADGWCGKSEGNVRFRAWTKLATAVLLATAMTLAGSGLAPQRAEASACARACYAAHAQCRKRTRGKPMCEQRLHDCLRQCVNR